MTGCLTEEETSRVFLTQARLDRVSVTIASGQLTLKQRVLRAGGWNLAGYGVIQAIRLGSNLIITRLLVPEVFGVIAIVTLVLTVVTFFSDIGLRQNVVQSARGDDPLFLDTVWCVQILRGIAIWFVTILVA